MELTEGTNEWACLVCSFINIRGAIFCAGCAERMCGANARMLGVGGGRARARARGAALVTDEEEIALAVGGAAWERNRDFCLARTEKIKKAGLAAGKNLALPPCINPACIIKNRLATHAWVNCSAADGPKDKQCWSAHCVGTPYVRGHTFYECYKEWGGLSKRGARGPSKRPPK